MKCPEKILDELPTHFWIEQICLEDYDIKEFHKDYIITNFWMVEIK